MIIVRIGQLPGRIFDYVEYLLNLIKYPYYLFREMINAVIERTVVAMPRKIPTFFKV
jgi:hypothetical protein